MAVAIDAAVTAARSADGAGFEEAVAVLRALDPEQLAVLLGSVARELLERSYPDGLDADDAEQILVSCVKSAAAWYQALDGDALTRALTGALGIHDPDDEQAPPGPVVVTHGLLLIADRLSILALELPPVLDRALRDLMQSQTMEQP